jgi:hypothetical protein
MTRHEPRPRRARLEDRIHAALRQAIAEGRLDAAEHLLRALEVLAPLCTPGSPLAEAYLLLAEPEASRRKTGSPALARRSPGRRRTA